MILLERNSCTKINKIDVFEQTKTHSILSKKVFKGDDVTWSSTKMFSKRKKKISDRSCTKIKSIC